MSDEAEVLDEDFDPIASLSGPLMKKVLSEVAMERVRQDGELGFFRDYPDDATDRSTGAITWFRFVSEAVIGIDLAVGEVQRRRRVLILAALSVAWLEAIDRRKDEKRIAMKTAPPSWWVRLGQWFNRYFVRTF